MTYGKQRMDEIHVAGAHGFEDEGWGSVGRQMRHGRNVGDERSTVSINAKVDPAYPG